MALAVDVTHVQDLIDTRRSVAIPCEKSHSGISGTSFTMSFNPTAEQYRQAQEQMKNMSPDELAMHFRNMTPAQKLQVQQMGMCIASVLQDEGFFLSMSSKRWLCQFHAFNPSQCLEHFPIFF